MVQPVGLKKREKHKGLGRGQLYHRGHVGGQAVAQVTRDDKSKRAKLHGN